MAMTRRSHPARRGALAVEGAIVYGVLFLLVLTIVVGGVGVFRYQQVACLAREGSRWAAVHGADYQTDNKAAAVTQDDVLKKAVLPMAAGMDPSAVAAQVQFIDRAAGTASAWDGSAHPPTGRARSGDLATNRVRVTVTYQWMPGALLAGPLTLSSTS